MNAPLKLWSFDYCESSYVKPADRHCQRSHTRYAHRYTWKKHYSFGVFSLMYKCLVEPTPVFPHYSADLRDPRRLGRRPALPATSSAPAPRRPPRPQPGAQRRASQAGLKPGASPSAGTSSAAQTEPSP